MSDGQIDPTSRTAKSNEYSAPLYLVTLLAVSLLCVVSVAIWGMIGRDHLGAISAGRDEKWYQDLGGASVTEIQDQDIFFHAIGSSIKNLKRADVVIVGSSLVAFAVNGKIAKSELTDKFGLSFYNMSFVGISSGEFTRRILLKYDIRPSLLIINADDGGGGGSFFGKGIQRSFSADVRTIAAAEHGKIVGFKEVIRRNLRWRGETSLQGLFNPMALENPNRVAIPRFFRDAQTGDMDFSDFPKYGSDNNSPWLLKRDPDCHTNRDTINIAKQFVQSIGTETILTLVPNMHYCEQQAREIADALGIELVLSGNLSYSTLDNGGHLDRRGSMQFTSDLIAALVKTSTFQRVLENTRRSKTAIDISR